MYLSRVSVGSLAKMYKSKLLNINKIKDKKSLDLLDKCEELDDIFLAIEKLNQELI